MVLVVQTTLGVSFPADAPPNYFVATTGTAGGTGRLADPISYSTLLTNIAVPYKSNNAVFWMRGGSYTNLLNATPGYPNNSLVSTGAITIRAYPKEAPVLRCGLVVASNITLSGLTLWSPMTSMVLTDVPPGGDYSVGLNITGSSNRIIGNNIVGHGGGVLAFGGSSNLVFYGNVVLASGVEYTNPVPRNGGHGIYMQNKDGIKDVTLNHILFACSDVATFHGTSVAYEQNQWFRSNFVCGSDSMGTVIQEVTYDLELADGDWSSGAGLSNIWVTDNFIVQDAGDGASSGIVLGGADTEGSPTNRDVHFDRNLCKCGIVFLNNYTNFSVASNLFWGVSTSEAGRVISRSDTVDYAPNSFDGNKWYYTGGNSSHIWMVYTNVDRFQIFPTNMTSVGTTVTVVYDAHRFKNGQTVSVGSVTPADYNGTYTITVADANTFTYTFAGSGSPTATGGYIKLSSKDLMTLGGWQEQILGDSNATLSVSAPAEVITRLWINQFRDAYDPWWGDVAIWNPNRASNNVFVALSGLPSGTGIKVYYTGDILGSPILTTTYDGSGINIPMTNLPTYQPNDPTWPKLPQPTNGASFRVFLTDFANSASVTTLRVGTLRGP